MVSRFRTAFIVLLMSLPPGTAAWGQSFPIIEPEPLPEPPEEIGAWYLRGDIAYVPKGETDVIYNEDVARLNFGYADLDQTARIGVGLGRRFGDYFRADMTLDFSAETSLTGGTPAPCGPASCGTVESADTTMLALMLNGYANLGYFEGFSPYVGAGVGFAYMNWDYNGGLGNFSNEDVRFAYALMAGLSYDINPNWTVDAGYRFFNVPDGNLVDDNAVLGGDIRYEDLVSHEIRIGVRYTFGDFFE